MDIFFSRHQKQVKASISTGQREPDMNSHLFFYWNCDNELFAELLSGDFQNRLQKAIQKARQEEYLHGWADAKSKRKKKTFFSCVLRKFYND